MTCAECGHDDVETVRIEYVEATTETLQLCEGCRREFEAGDLVTDVSAVSTNQD